MAIDRIGINQAMPDIGLISGNSKPADKPNPSGRSSPTTNVSRKEDSITSPSGYRSLWSSDPTMGLLASQIRSADKAMGRIETYIDRMKEQLGNIIKKYPPYPLDSPKRNEHLQEYAALRKEIEQMTIPPIRESVAGGPKKVTTELSIPVLHGGSSDQEVSAAADGLQKAKETVVAGRSQLQADTAVVADAAFRGAKNTQPTPEASQSDVAAFNAGQAEQKSVEVRGQFIADTARTITAGPDRLLQAL